MIAEKELPEQITENKPKKITASYIYDSTATLGELFFSAFSAIGKTLLNLLSGILMTILVGWAHISRFLKRIFAKLAETVITPFIRYNKALKMGKNEISKARQQKGATGGAVAATRVTGRMLFGKRGIIVTIVNWVLPIMSCIFLFNVISYANNQMYALKLTVNGNFIGYIDDESVYNTSEKDVRSRIDFTGSTTKSIVFEPVYEVAAIGYGTTLNSNQLTDKILELIDAEISDGYGMYIGDAYYGTLVSHDKVDAALEELLDRYRSGSAKETVAFDKEITFIPGKYMTDSFVDEDKMIEKLTSYKRVASYYTVVNGDSAAAIAKKVDMTYEELAALNGEFNVNTPVYGGQQIKITQDEPFLTVIVTREEHYNESFDYDTTYNDDSTIFEGDKLERRKGVAGERAVVADVSYINGVEVNRHIISRTVTKEPVTRIVSVGTKPRTSNAAPAQTVAAGNYLWPVGGNGGKISCLPWIAVTNLGYSAYYSYYGHKGLDIAGSYGTPIYAAGTGTIITMKELSTGYGHYIVIQHDDGKQTLYGHMSTFSSTMYVGKRVTMGECIGYMGSTGNSTGNHLHFEVIINGKRQYPPDYLPTHISQWGLYF